MIPILFKSDEVDFTTNGVGLLNDIYGVDVQEQRNGLLTLTASYPTNAKHYKDIEAGRIIYAKPNPLDGAQAFRIVKTELDISGYNLNIEADHITYDLTHNLVKSVHLQGNGQNAMTHLQNATVTPHLFRFVSDLQHEGDSTLKMVNPMEAIAGTEGSILQIWGGELKRDNRTVSMLSRRGRDNFTTFRLGKNINGLKYTVDMSNVVTRIIPTVVRSNDESSFIVGDTVDSKNITKYPNAYLQHVDMGDKITIADGDTDEAIKAKIDAKAKGWFTQSANSGIDLPQVTVEIDVTSLQDSADYQDKFRNLESVGLTDTVSVYVPEFGVNVTAIVNELHYDPLTERVTSLVVGTSKKSFADNNSNALSELQNKITQIRQDATTAIVSSNGKNTNYYGTEEPKHPVEGDLWFKQVGDETYLMIFKDGRWQEWVSTKTQEKIAKAVDDAIKEAQKYTDELNDKQAQEFQEFQADTNKKLDSAASAVEGVSKESTSMAASASAHADSMADSAAAYGKAQAASALSNANVELASAKEALGKDITKAQSDITATQKELSGKVSQADFDKETGDLTTKYGQVKTTADAVTTDVNKYKKSNDGRIAADEANITANSKAIGLKVSQTDFDKQNKEVNSKFATQQITVDKINNTVSELQAKANAQGQVNLIMNSEFNPDLEGWELTSDGGNTKLPYRSYTSRDINATTVGFDTTKGATNSWANLSQTVQLSSTPLANTSISLSWSSWAREVANYNGFHVLFYDKSNKQVGDEYREWTARGGGGDANSYTVRKKWENITVPDTATYLVLKFQAREGTGAYLAQPMLVLGPTIGDYVPGNYNNNNRVAALELDINGITGLVKDPNKGLSATWNLASKGQTLAVQAQKDATTAITTAKGIQAQVTSNDGDIKNLQSKTTQLAGQITDEVKDRKSGDSTIRTQLTDLIDQRVKDTKKGYESAISQSADTVMANISQPNRLLNSDFSPDLENWNVANNGANGKNYNFYRSYIVDGRTVVGVNVPTNAGSDANKWYSYFEQDVAVPGNNDNTKISLSWDVRTVTNVNYNSLWIIFKDANHNTISGDLNVLKYWNGPADGNWHSKKEENITVPKEAKFVRISFQCREGTNAYLSKPMLVFRSVAMTYMPGSYSGMNTQTVLKLAKDNWALGIADNAGRIISGINGDKSGTVIQGKKLIINSDTTINGKAFIDGSVIKNASISQAQIGNAAVGNAQIINLDVSKLSGNIANFITGNIKTLNSHVLYGDTGHLGTVDTGRVINKQDNHLQLAAKNMYNNSTDRAQLELLANTNDIDANMRGTLNYYGNPGTKGAGLGIRFKGNQILAIDEKGDSKNLYLSPYAGGEVRAVSRDAKSYYGMAASAFRVASQRKFKKNIQTFGDDALSIVKNTKIRQYEKNGISEIGVIADEADERILSDDKKFVSLYDYASVLYKAVQELTKKVEELEDERTSN